MLLPIDCRKKALRPGDKVFALFVVILFSRGLFKYLFSSRSVGFLSSSCVTILELGPSVLFSEKKKILDCVAFRLRRNE